MWSGWDGVGTAAVTLVGPIAYFTRVRWQYIDALQRSTSMTTSMTMTDSLLGIGKVVSPYYMLIEMTFDSSARIFPCSQVSALRSKLHQIALQLRVSLFLGPQVERDRRHLIHDRFG